MSKETDIEEAAENKISKMLKETPLQIRLQVSNQMSFIDLICELGYREKKPWSEEENDLLYKICELANKEAAHQISIISEWQQSQSIPAPVEDKTFVFEYKSLGNDFNVTISAKNLNNAIKSFAAKYSSIEEIYSVKEINQNNETR